jgi:hypothetical protein
VCGRRLESAWSIGRPAYRCRHGYCSVTVPDPARPKNTYVREDQIVPHPAALAILLAGKGTPDPERKANVTAPAQAAGLIDRLRATGAMLTYDSATRTVRAGGEIAVVVATGQRS